MFLAFFYYFTMLRGTAGSCNGQAYYLNPRWLPRSSPGGSPPWVVPLNGQTGSPGVINIINNSLAFPCNEAHLTSVR